MRIGNRAESIRDALRNRACIGATREAPQHSVSNTMLGRWERGQTILDDVPSKTDLARATNQEIQSGNLVLGTPFPHHTQRMHVLARLLQQGAQLLCKTQDARCKMQEKEASS